VLRLLAPLFFMLLLWLLDLAVKADNVNLDTYTNNPSPTVTSLGAITSCTDDVYARSPCWDFVYSPNGSDVAEVRPQRSAARGGAAAGALRRRAAPSRSWTTASRLAPTRSRF
jgi:hypothetical protein